jgi:quinohemoprotein ethanol dehydrogenase
MQVPGRFWSRALAALILVIAAAPPAVAAPADQAATMPVGEPAGNDWMTYGGNLFNQRYSSLNQINASNVANLKGACVFHTTQNGVDPDLLTASSFESSPIVMGGTMYLSGPQSQVWALDATSCSLKWKYQPDLVGMRLLPICCGLVNRGVAVGGGRVYVAQLDAKLVALDQNTGGVVWTTQVDDPRAGYAETMAPLYYNGRVYVGVSGAEYEIRGHVTAYDAATGNQVWRFFTIPGPGEPGHETWPQDTNAWQGGGGSVWQTPALDPAENSLYVAVGNNSPDLDGGIRAGDNLYSESIVALDLNTGQPKWHFQEVHHDIWDLDAVSPNILFDTTINGRAVKGIGEAGKTGWVYLLDRTNGQPLLPINETPVPQMGSQNTAATQPIPVGDSFVPTMDPSQCNPPVQMGGQMLQPQGAFTPFSVEPRLACPGANGGSEWSTSSYNPQTELFYTCGIHQPMVWTLQPDQLQREQPVLRLGSVFTTAPGAQTYGTLTAMDVHTNRIRWQNKLDQMCIGGSTTTAGGLVFLGEANGNFNAYDASSGQRLWQFQTGAGANAPPVIYQVGNTEYVAVASGGNRQLDFPRGDSLWIFSLNGSMSPVAAPSLQAAAAPAPTAGGAASATIFDFKFAPAELHVPIGTTVTWTNQDAVEHTVTASRNQATADPSSAYEFTSPLLDTGESFSFTFNDVGEFAYHCNPHPFMGAKVIVEAAATPPLQPGPAAPGGPAPAAPAPAAPAPAPVQVPRGALPLAASTDDAPILYAAVASSLDPVTNRAAIRLPRVSLDPNGDATVVFAIRNEQDDPAAIRDGAVADTLTVLDSVYQSPEASRVNILTVLGTFPVKGTKSPAPRETPVVRAVLSADKAAQIDWATLTPQALPQVADVWWIHGAFDALASPEAAVATEVVTPGQLSQVTSASPDLGEMRSQLDTAVAHVNEALYALTSSEVRIARSQFRQFFDVWDELDGPIQALYPSSYATIDAEIERAEIALLHSDPEDVPTARFALVGLRGALIDISQDLEKR